MDELLDHYLTMKRRLSWLATVSMIALCGSAAQGAENRHLPDSIKRGKQYTIEQFMKTVRIGDRLLDGSVRGRLERLRERLIAGNRPQTAARRA